MIRSIRFQAALGATFIFLIMLFGAGRADATVPSGFNDETVFGGLSNPTMVRFAPDGRVFVAEKGGKILVFENLQDETPEVFADLSKPVYDFEDHGLLGIALDPMFDMGSPYVYAIYTFNHKLANKATQVPQVTDPEAVTPAWSSEKSDFETDQCPESEHVSQEHEAGHEEVEELLGCEVSGLVVRMTASAAGNHALPSAQDPEQKVLLEGWCQQSTTHSIGNIGFGPEGNLFVSGGEGSMFSKADYGEFGNPCDDPYEAPHGVEPDRRSSALGGSLRAQSVLRDHSLPGHQTLLSGTVLRVDKETGEGVPGNPFYGISTEKNAKRIIAFGFRQPWRFAFNPRTSKLFVDNVGDGTYEEMDRLELDGAADYSDGEPAYNSGWPCYEGGPSGPHKNEHYTYASEEFPTLNYCIDMYEAEEHGKTETSAPFYSYEHSGPIVPDDSCDPAPTLTDIGGIAFYEGSHYPAAYKNSLFFADPIRGCIYVMKASPDGEPNPASVSTFVSGKNPFSFPGIDIEQGPEGDIFYTEFDSPEHGTVHRITHPETQEEKETREREERETREREEQVAHEREQTETREREERIAREREEAEARQREEARKPDETSPASPNPGTTPTSTPPPTYGPPKLGRHPAKTTRNATAKFTFQAAKGLTFRCSLDGKTSSRCSSPRTYKHLAVGSHVFRVFAVDSSGKRATKTTKYSWTLKGSGSAR